MLSSNASEPSSSVSLISVSAVSVLRLRRNICTPTGQLHALSLRDERACSGKNVERGVGGYVWGLMLSVKTIRRTQAESD